MKTLSAFIILLLGALLIAACCPPPCCPKAPIPPPIDVSCAKIEHCDDPALVCDAGTWPTHCSGPGAPNCKLMGDYDCDDSGSPEPVWCCVQ